MAAVLAAVLVAALAAALAGGPLPSVPPALAAGGHDAFAADLVRLLNARRAGAGLMVLLPDSSLDRVAGEVVRSRAPRGGRLVPLGANDLVAPLARAGVRGRVVQGIQAFHGLDARTLVESLMEDPGDRGEFLNPSYHRIGSASADLANGRRYLVILLSTDQVDEEECRRRIYELVNEIRHDHSLMPVSWDRRLAEAAQIRARELDRVFGHQRPSGQSWTTVLEELGISARAAGENVAQGHKDARDVMKAFMGSPGHRGTILTPEYTLMGVGVSVSADGLLNCAQLFIRRR
jgi:uncharacterized protein YkwD